MTAELMDHSVSAHIVLCTRSWVLVPPILVFACISGSEMFDCLDGQAVSRCSTRGESEKSIAYR